MAEIEEISSDKIKEITASRGFDPDLIHKDYYITAILYLIKGIEGIYFKGGTALQKIFLDYSRLSEDIDLTLTKDIKEIKKKIKETIKKSRLFDKITKDKDVEGFTRLVVHYKDFSNEDKILFIDINQRATLLMKPEEHKIKHFYKESIPTFSFNTLSKEEMTAEKIAAAIGRNQPRDHYDVYKIIKNKMPINLKLVRKKCKQSGFNFDIIKMFNQAKKLKNRWDQDLLPLVAKEVSFEEVMKTLAKHFKLKEEKQRQKNQMIK